MTIADVLGLSVHDAVEQFAGRPPIAAALRPVAEVGLGYLKLGEPTPSLSGGESQRLKIASRLRSSQRGALYVFDEPTTGLHPLDVATLVSVFDRLLDAGATIIVIDHDLDLLAAADHLIDMGPGGGPEGGRVLAAGTPERGGPGRGQRDRAVAGRIPGAWRLSCAHGYATGASSPLARRCATANPHGMLSRRTSPRPRTRGVGRMAPSARHATATPPHVRPLQGWS